MEGMSTHELRAELARARREVQALQLQLTQCRRELRGARELLAAVAHEINNPLAYIQSNLCSLSRYAGKLARYAGAVAEAEPLRSSGDPSARRLGERLAQLRARLKLDFVLDDLEPLVQQSLRGTARVQRVVQALQQASGAAGADRRGALLNTSTPQARHGGLR